MASSYYYDFNVIYNKANSHMSKTRDTGLSLQFTECVVKKLDGWGFKKSYYHERDALPGRNVFKELFRVITDSKWTVVVITPGFVHDCWAIYSQQTAFKKLLTKDGSTRLVPLVVGNVTVPEDLDVQNALHFTDDNYEREGTQWEKLRKVLEDNIPIRAVNAEEEERHKNAQETSDNIGRTERQGMYVTQPTSTESEPHTLVLRRCYDRLVNSMDPDKLLDSLEVKDVLDHNTIRDIREERTTSAKNRSIADLMIKLSKRKYEKFKESLHESYHDDEILAYMMQEEENLHYEAPPADGARSVDPSQPEEGEDETDLGMATGPMDGENLPVSTPQQMCLGTGPDVNVPHASSEASIQSVQQQIPVQSLEMDQRASTVQGSMTVEASPKIMLRPPSKQNTAHNTSGAGDALNSSNNTILHKDANQTTVKEVWSPQNNTEFITPSQVATLASASNVANNNGANSSQTRREANVATNAEETAIKEVLSPQSVTEVFTQSRVETVGASAPVVPDEKSNTLPAEQLVPSQLLSLSQDKDLTMDNGVPAVEIGLISAGSLSLSSLAESGYDTSMTESTPSGDSIYTESPSSEARGDGDGSPSSNDEVVVVVEAANNNSSGTGIVWRGETSNPENVSQGDTQKPSEGPIRPGSIQLGLTQPLSSQPASGRPGSTMPDVTMPEPSQSGWTSLAFIGMRSMQEVFFNTAAYHEGS